MLNCNHSWVICTCLLLWCDNICRGEGAGPDPDCSAAEVLGKEMQSVWRTATPGQRGETGTSGLQKHREHQTQVLVLVDVNYLWSASPALWHVGSGGRWVGTGHWFNFSSSLRDGSKLHTRNTLLKHGLIVVLPSSALSANDSNSPCQHRTRTNNRAVRMMTHRVSLKKKVY